MDFTDKYQNGYVQPSMTDIAMQQIAAVSAEVRNLSQSVVANNSYMAGVIQAEIAKGERERRKQRKKEILSYIAVANNDFGFVKLYDDQTQSIVRLTINLVPDFEIFRIKMEELDEDERYFAIHFETADFCIVEERKKFTGKLMYERLITKGVKFNEEIPRSKIREALYGFFAPLIEKAEVASIAVLAGWNKGKFASSETFIFRENELDCPLPVKRKHFKDYGSMGLWPEEYFKSVRKISDWKNRLWMMIYPVGAIFSSVFQESGIRNQRVLNFAMLESVPKKRLLPYLQIFNRDKAMEQPECPKDVLYIKDEPIFFDIKSAYGDSKYKKEKRLQMCKGIADGVINGDFIRADGVLVSAPIVIFSDRALRGKNVINIFVDQDFFVEEREEDKVQATPQRDEIGIVFYHIVGHYEKNYGDLKNLLETGRQIDPGIAWLCISYQICREFWDRHGVDMREMAGLPDTIRFRELVDDSTMFQDDLVADFVRIVRREIQNWVVKEKKDGKGDGKEIIANDDFLWIPTYVLREMLSAYGSLEQKALFLERLKNEGWMITDGEGMSRKIQVSGKRYEAYQFRRDLFNAKGKADIVELGKEDMDD